MTVLEVLKATRELLSAPERWTKGRYARNADGSCVPPTAPGAVCFCLEGALCRVTAGMERAELLVCEARIALERHGGSDSLRRNGIVAWNDRKIRKFEQVTKALERTIAVLAESEHPDVP